MDLSTTYLGLRLAHPLMPGASPLVDDLDEVRRLEDAGAAAIVMHSIFEEQVRLDQLAAHRHVDEPAESFGEALSYFPSTGAFALGPDEYLEQVRRIRTAVAVPVIGSLNGVSLGGWLEYARLIEEAGAHALELNLYGLPTDAHLDASDVDAQCIDVVRAVTQAVHIPVAVKLSPFHSSLPHLARRIEEAGAAGLVIFNRFYQADIDPEALEVRPRLQLSDSSELLLRVRWLAVLSAQRRLSLAASGGVHTAIDAVKALMSGAHAVQMVSALLLSGTKHLARVLADLRAWLAEHEYDSLGGMIGSMNLARCPDPGAYERANYVQVLQSWHGGDGPRTK
jgi:dihydroorotate dehydrogenase (fumarate)